MTIVERRIYPRYDCAFQVRLVDSQDQSHLVNADNISLNGIALSIDQSLKNTLLGQGCHLLAGDSVKIYLPNPENGPDNSPDTGSGQEQAFTCRIQYLRRLSQQHYQLGGLFDQADEQQQNLLQVLVNQNKIL